MNVNAWEMILLSLEIEEEGNHEWTRILPKTKNTRILYSNSCLFVAIRG